MKIKIPWYRKTVKGIADIENEIPLDDFNLPRRKKKKHPDKPQNPRERKLVPELETYPVKEPQPSKAFAEIPDYINATLPWMVPKDWKGLAPDGKFKIPELKMPDINGKLTPDLMPGIKMPAIEILFQLMASEESGKYTKVLDDYNNITMEILWNTMNPTFIYEYPSYEQVNEFLSNNDINELTNSDVIEYFKKQNVSGKNLNTSGFRIFSFIKLIETMDTIDAIFVPPVNNNKGPKIY